ncbi:MAG: hypothetical protein IKW89_14330 [Bacteroidales bacterium]|nr:hypothetical protein [Bacteroidales bacterium]
MIRKIILLLASLALPSAALLADSRPSDDKDVAVRQFFNKTDLQWNNLKGDVLSTHTVNLGFRKAYGEWELGGAPVNSHEGEEYVIYGSSGNRLLKMLWGYNDPQYALLYNYGADGKLSSVDTYNFRHNYVDYKPHGQISELDAIWIAELIDHKNIARKNYRGGYLKHSVYEYDGNGRLKSIITRPDDDPQAGGARDIFRYEADGSYTMVRYDENGTEEMRFQGSSDGRKESRKTQYIVAYIERDKDGRMTGVGGGGGGSNGYATQRNHYVYNEHGDLLIVTEDARLVDRDKDLPWLESQTDLGAFTYYEYEYDSKGNWVTRKTYVHYSMNKEINLKKWEERTILYSGDIGKSGEEYMAACKSEIDVYQSRMEEAAAKAAANAAEDERLKAEHPYVKYDGDLADDILQEVLPKLPKVSALKALSSGAEGTVSIKLTINRNGHLSAKAAEDYSNRSDRAQLIVKEAVKAAEGLSGSPKWTPGYAGVTYSVDFHYYIGGKVVVEDSGYEVR